MVLIENKIKTFFGSNLISESDKILKVVAEFFGIGLQELYRKNRSDPIVVARQIAAYFLRIHLGLSFKEIGIYLGRKDHSTILYSVRKIEEEIKRKSNIEKTVKSIDNILHEQNIIKG